MKFVRFHPKEDTLFSASYDDSIKVPKNLSTSSKEDYRSSIPNIRVVSGFGDPGCSAQNVACQCYVGRGVAGVGGG